jgi:Uncharacterised protein family (UPF0014)
MIITAMRLGLQPTLNNMNVLGLVAIPGMMVRHSPISMPIFCFHLFCFAATSTKFVARDYCFVFLSAAAIARHTSLYSLLLASSVGSASTSATAVVITLGSTTVNCYCRY